VKARKIRKEKREGERQESRKEESNQRWKKRERTDSMHNSQPCR
jgi:hypothetical protein